MSPQPPFLDRHKLWRDTDNRIIAGVCSGIAHHFGFSTKTTRILAFAGLFFLPWLVIVGYALLAWLLPGKPQGLFRDEMQQKRARQIHKSPTRSMAQLRRRLAGIERKLAHAEAHITDKDYQLNQQFRNL